MIWLAACTPSVPALSSVEYDLGEPASQLRFHEDGALFVLAGDRVYRIGAGGGEPVLIGDGALSAVPVRRTGDVVVHTAQGEIRVWSPDGTAEVVVQNVFDVDDLRVSDDGALAFWNDQFFNTYVLDLNLGLLRDLQFDGHLLGLSSDARQALIADGMWLNWYLVYTDVAHAVPVRYPAGDIVDIVIVGRDPRYAEVLPPEDGEGPDWMLVADGDGNVPLAATTAGTWLQGAFTADGSTILTVEAPAEGDPVFARYTADLSEAEILGQGALAALPLSTDDPATAAPDGTALAYPSAAGVTVIGHQPSSG
jgi:hypothetical protein